jgi:hypothetical protein
MKESAAQVASEGNEKSQRKETKGLLLPSTNCHISRPPKPHYAEKSPSTIRKFEF